MNIPTLKILIISPFENHAAGRGDRNMRIESELVLRGHQVTFATGNFDHALKSHISVEKLPPRTGLMVIGLPGYHSHVGLARMWCHIVFAFKLWLRTIWVRWDIVVVSSIPPEALFTARFLRKRALIIDIRDIWPDALQAYGKRSLATQAFSAYCRMIYSATLKYAKRIMIVACSYRGWLAEYIDAAHGRQRQVKFVPLGFKREDFRPMSDNDGNKAFEFCYAGGVTPQFDIREFAPELKSKRIAIIGSGPLTNAWKHSFPNSIFYGTTTRTEAISIMYQSRRLLLPSNNTLPNKAFDYFALGQPVLLGRDCSREIRYLLGLRSRRNLGPTETWEDYRVIEQEAITKREADIIEDSLK